MALPDTNEPGVGAGKTLVFPRKDGPKSGKDNASHLPVYRTSGGTKKDGTPVDDSNRKLTQAQMAKDLDETGGRALDKRAWQDGKLTAGRGFKPAAPGGGPAPVVDPNDLGPTNVDAVAADNLAGLNKVGAVVAAKPNTAWTKRQFVTVTKTGNKVHWDGTKWASGAAT